RASRHSPKKMNVEPVTAPVPYAAANATSRAIQMAPNSQPQGCFRIPTSLKDGATCRPTPDAYFIDHVTWVGTRSDDCCPRSRSPGTAIRRNLYEMWEGPR